MDMEKTNKIFLFSIVALGMILMATAIYPSAEQETTTITVSAAASLTEAFTDLATRFEEENPEIDLNLNFAGSGTLRMQIESGAPIDVFASASQKHVNLLSDAGLIDEDSRKDFAENSLVLIAPIDSQLNITDLQDLVDTEVERIAIGDPETAPVGNYAKQSITEAGLWDLLENKLVYGENVKQVLVYVETNEVEAGFVYMTDTKTAQSDMIKIITTVPVTTPISYPIAIITSSEHKEESQKFVDFVTGEKGRSILGSYGFTA
jgi:molybdate transport system substrate-binding protein